MLALVILLAGTTVLTGALLALLVARPPSWLAERARTVDPAAAAALDRTPRPPVAAGTTRRIVYDQTVKVVREQLAAQQVRADVRLHELREQA